MMGRPGEVLVVLVNEEGKESICSSIDTDLVSVLDRYTIQCHNDVTASDAVAIKLVPSAKVSIAPILQITSGHARFILTYSEESQNVSTQSIPPEESFDWSSEPSSTGNPYFPPICISRHLRKSHRQGNEGGKGEAIPDVEHSIFTTENANDQLRTFDLSTESTYENRASINMPSETLLSTAVEEKSSIPFESAEFRNKNLSDAAVSTKSKGIQKSADSTVSDMSISGADEGLFQLSESPLDSNLSPQPDLVTSTQATLIQSRVALKTKEVQPQNPPQNDAEVLPQEAQNVSKETKVNETVLNLLTAGSGALSTTNLVMIIVIISIVVLIAITAAVWFFCAHDK
ncbi:hypothetical protein TSMEX_002303 [Taenia solium]|eukprot:TsM_000941600 transcript=TsM_000941600 gene=TsM_000941600